MRQEWRFWLGRVQRLQDWVNLPAHDDDLAAKALRMLDVWQKPEREAAETLDDIVRIIRRRTMPDIELPDLRQFIIDWLRQDAVSEPAAATYLAKCE